MGLTPLSRSKHRFALRPGAPSAAPRSQHFSQRFVLDPQFRAYGLAYTIPPSQNNPLPPRFRNDSL